MNKIILIAVILGGFVSGIQNALQVMRWLPILDDTGPPPASRNLSDTKDLVPLIAVKPTASVTNMQGLGVNVGLWSYYGTAAGDFQNLIWNPGFEKSESGRVVGVPASGLSAIQFCDENNWFPYPSGFYNGATFQDVYVTGSGASTTAATRGTGTITSYNPTGCGGSTPQFTYSAAFAIQAGDYIIFNQVGNPGQVPQGWWNSDNDPRWTVAADHEPNGDGQQVLDVQLTGAGNKIYDYTDTCGNCYTNPSGGTQNFILVNGPWTVSIWAKCTSCVGASVTLVLNRGGTTFLNQTFTPTSTWAQYSYSFTGNETSLSSNVGALQLTISANGTSGDLRFDDAFMGPTGAATTPWSDAFMSVMQTLHPGVIREQQFDYGQSYANMVADDAARGLASYSATTAGNATWTYNLDGFLKLASTIGATPWINVPMALTDSELSSLGSYLAIEQSKYNFSTILLEMADEQWNGGMCNGVCTSYSPNIYTAINGRQFGLIKAAAGAGVPLKTIAGGQYGNPDLSTTAGTASAQGINYVDMAPYYFTCDNTGKTTAAYMSDFLGDQYMQPAYMQSSLSLLGSLPGVGYEAGPGAVWGTMTNAERNGILAGAGSATADAEDALNWWSLGGRYLTEWNLSQINFTSTQQASESGLCTTSDAPPTGFQAYMWGVVHDYYTPLIRPRGLAMQLLNRYFIMSKTGNLHAAKVVRYKGVVAGAWEDQAHGYGWNVAAVNTMPYAQRLAVRFPGESGLPTGKVWQIDHRHAISDENEQCESTKAKCQATVTIGQGEPIIGEPGSNSIILSVPAYSIVVGQSR